MKNTLILSLGTFLPRVAVFITLPIYTANLSKADYGTYDVVVFIAYLMTVVITMQVHQAAFRFLVGEKDSEKKIEVISNTTLFVLPTAITAALAIFLLLWSENSISVRIAISCYIFMEIILSVVGQIIRGLGGNKVYSIGAIIQSFLNMVFVVVLMEFLDKGFLGLLTSLNIAILCAVIYMTSKIGLTKYIRIQSFNKSMIAQMISYSWPLIPNSISMWLLNVINRIIIIIVLGIEMSAVFAVATKIPLLFTTAYGAFNMAWQESASIASEDKDSGEYYGNIFDGLFGFLVGAMAVLIATTPFVFELLIRGDYQEAYYQMPLLFIGMFFSSLASFYGGIYIALKKTKSVGISTIVAVGIALLINTTLINKLGLYAASISTMVSFLALTVYRGYDTKKFRKINYKKKKIVLGISLLVVMCVFCYQKDLVYNIMNMVLAVAVAVTYNLSIIKTVLSKVMSKRFAKGNKEVLQQK